MVEYRRIYNTTIKKFLIGLGLGIPLIFGIFYYLQAQGDIIITGYSGDVVCAGVESSPCYAYINFTANTNIFIYPSGNWSDTISTDKPMKDIVLQLWDGDWKTVYLNKTWNNSVSYALKFDKNQSYQLRFIGYKNDPSDTVKWSFGNIDPLWQGVTKDTVFTTLIENSADIDGGYAIFEMYNPLEKEIPMSNLMFDFIQDKGVVKSYNTYLEKNISYQEDVCEKKLIEEKVCDGIDDVTKDEIKYDCSVYEDVCNKEEKWRLEWVEFSTIPHGKSRVMMTASWDIGLGEKAIDWKPVLRLDKVDIGKASDLYLKMDEWAWFNQSFSRCRNINVTNNQTQITNYPAYILLTKDSDMLSNYQDLRFVNAVCDNGGNVIPFEIENYTSTSAHLWVQIPTLSNGNTTISVYYGNSTPVENGENKTGVWDNDYRGVWHMSELTGSSVYDSTKRNNVGTYYQTGSPTNVVSVAGVVGNAISFTAGSLNHIIVANESEFDLLTDYTVEMLFKHVTYSGGFEGFLNKHSGTNPGILLYCQANLSKTFYTSASNYMVYGTNCASNQGWQYNFINISSTPTAYAHENGTFRNSGTMGGTTQNNALNFGRLSSDTSYYFTGYIDEVRISNVTRSFAYNMENYYLFYYQSSFVSVGDEIREKIPPQWQNQGTNSTTNIIPVGGAINLTAQGKDETALDWAWLSTNETNVTTNTSFKAHEDDFGSFRSAIWIGQTFTPVATSNYSIVKLLLNRTGNPTGFVVGIRNIDGTNHPTGNDLCNGTYDASLITTSSAQWYDIITSGCQLNTSTEYAMVARTSTGDASNLISWIRDDDNQYSGGEFEYSTNSGLSWTTYSGYDYLFEVYGSSFTWQNKTAYNSPMNMNDAVNTWTWSNFTWQNASIVSGTIVGWRIYYNDTSNNTNVTNVMTFCVGTCVTVADTTPPTYTSFGSNVTNYTRISSDTRIGYYALWSDNNQSGQAMNSSMRNTTSFTNGTWANWGTGNWTNYTVYPNLGNGENYTVKIYANDSSNNMNVTGTLYWMEGTAPVITISSPTNTTYLTTSVWANITLDEKGSQCFRSLDGGANTSMANSTGNWNSQMTSISLGYHKVQFYCNDTYNNNATVATQYFTVSVPIMATQWAEIKWFNYTHINISINVLTYNNHTDTISNIGVDVMQNYTDYSIASLASKATDLHIEEKQFIRPAVNDTWMNFTNITLSGQATGYSNNFTFIVPVDPPTKSEPPVGDTCECSSIQAGTVINCAENCDITTVCNANGQNIIASGSGTILLTANVINFGNINIINGCNVICNGGCFYEGP